MSVKLSIEEVIQEIENFLNGSGGAYDWDDFTTFTIRDQQLNAIRIECAELPDKYPSGNCRQYCSNEGLERLKEIINELRTMRGESR